MEKNRGPAGGKKSEVGKDFSGYYVSWERKKSRKNQENKVKKNQWKSREFQEKIKKKSRKINEKVENSKKKIKKKTHYTGAMRD